MEAWFESNTHVGLRAMSRSFLKLIVFISTLTFTFAAGQVADAQRPVFIKGVCLEKISSDVLSSLKNEIRNSQKYRLVRDQSDEGKMDIVLTINMSCTEHKDISAIATVFGRVKCFGPTNCHHAIDGSSVRADLCNGDAATECGRSLFKAFDDYVINPIKPQLKLN